MSIPNIKFIIGLIQIIALKRADLKEKNRPHTHLYIDEFHNFITPTIEEILTESRKYKLFLTFAHQSVSQIKDANLRDIILDNTNVKIIGKNSNKTLDMMNKTLNTKLEDVAKLKAGEFNLQSGTNDVIKIYNTDKLLDGKCSISDEEWKEYKQYQLDYYYRSTLGKDNDDIISTKYDLDLMIDEFIKEIKSIEKIQSGDVSYFDKIKDIDADKYDILIYNFNNEIGYIARAELSNYFNIIYEEAYNITNDSLLEKLKNDPFFSNQIVNDSPTYKGQKRYKLS